LKEPSTTVKALPLYRHPTSSEIHLAGATIMGPLLD
jgi:hypothetical protein